MIKSQFNNCSENTMAGEYLRRLHFGTPNDETIVTVSDDEIIHLLSCLYPSGLTILSSHYLDRIAKVWNKRWRRNWRDAYTPDDRFYNQEMEIQAAFKNIATHIAAPILPNGAPNSLFYHDAWLWEKQLHMPLMIYSMKIAIYNFDEGEVKNCITFYNKHLSATMENYRVHRSQRKLGDTIKDEKGLLRENDTCVGAQEEMPIFHPYFFEPGMTLNDFIRKMRKNHLDRIAYIRGKWPSKVGSQLDGIEKRLFGLIGTAKRYLDELTGFDQSGPFSI